MTITATIFSLIGLGLSAGGRLFKKQENNMIFNCLSNIFFAVSYLFLGAYMGLGVMLVSALRTVVLYFNLKNHVEPQNNTLYLLILLFVTTSFISFTNWIDFCLIMAKSISFTYGAWQRDVKIFRWFSIVSCTFTIGYNAIYHGYMNIIAESISIIFTLTVMLSELIASKKKQKQNNN